LNSKNQLKLLYLDSISLANRNEVLTKENDDLKLSHLNNLEKLEELEDICKKLREKLGENERELERGENEGFRLKEELRFSEKSNTKKAEKIETLTLQLDKSTQNVAILKKNLSQKGKHIAILIKEKQRLTDEKYNRNKK